MSASRPFVREARAEPVDGGGDAIDRALRLGERLVGASLVFSESGAVADPTRALAPDAVQSEPVIGPDGESFGTLSAVDLTGRNRLDWDGRRALADVAALIAGDLHARARIGQTDHVTGLPNRRRFDRDFPRAVRLSAADSRLLLITLADARHYNELLRALGHVCAETFVRRGAEMIGAAAGGRRTLYHVSVLSFALLAGAEEAEPLAREIIRVFSSPVSCDGLPIATRIGVGLAPAESWRDRPAEALRAALAAAQDSRRVAQGFCNYDPRSDEQHVRAFGLLTDLSAALEQDGQLSLAFQPRIDLATGKAAGAEALIRWTHPTLGPISPAEFIPLAETTAIITTLTDWVLERACRQSAAWRAEGLTPRLSVNVSPSSLHDPDFVGRVAATLDAHRVDPADLEFELTEGTLTSTEAGVRATIDAFRASGTSIAIDDFGAGYSNLEYLTRLPADVLKIDRSFVQSLDSDPRRRRLVKSIIDLSHDLDFRVVAEGVETATAYDALSDWGCDEGQGFFMSRPLTPAAFRAFAASC